MSIPNISARTVYMGAKDGLSFDFFENSLHSLVEKAKESLSAFSITFPTESEETSSWDSIKQAVYGLFFQKQVSGFHKDLVVSHGNKCGFLVTGLALYGLDQENRPLCSLSNAEAASRFKASCELANERILLALAGDFSEDLYLQTQFILNSVDIQKILVGILKKQTLETSLNVLKEYFDVNFLIKMLSLTRVRSLLQLSADVRFLGQEGASQVLQRFIVLANSDYDSWLSGVLGTAGHPTFGEHTHSLLAAALLSLGWTAVDLQDREAISVSEIAETNVNSELTQYFSPLGTGEGEAQTQVHVHLPVIPQSVQETLLKTVDTVPPLFYKADV